MRIIGGKYKSRRISPPSNLPVRPTTDIAREGLFNLLRTRIDLEETHVIDLFSGTGFVAYEFISHGARSVTAVEEHHACIAFIRKCIETLEITNLHIVRADVFRFIRKGVSRAGLIFADPPYQLDALDALPDLILQSEILEPEGMLIVEHGPDYSFKNHPCFREERRYGKVHFSFFEKPPVA